MNDFGKFSILGILVLFAGGILGSAAPTPGARAAQDPKYGIGQWDPESGLGNHRAVVRVESIATPKTAAVRAHIPWRRRDLEPEKKNIIVVAAATGERIKNVAALAIARESGDIAFEPKTNPGDYFVYFMPYRSEGRKNYPNVKYDPPQTTADPAWLAAVAAVPSDALPEAAFAELQSADAFSAFTPMEIIATAEETKTL